MFWKKKKPRLQGLTIGICFQGVDVRQSAKKMNNRTEDRSDLNNYLIEQILNQGGLPVEVGTQYLEDLKNGKYEKVMSVIRQANLLLFGNIYRETYSNVAEDYDRTSFKCITRNGTIIGGGEFYDGTDAGELVNTAVKIMENIHIENLGKISEQGFEERTYTDVPSAIES